MCWQTAFALTGFAASVYAPAKYGLLTESVPSASLVKANAFWEVSVVLSILWGVGAVMQFLVQVWAQTQAGLTL